MISREQSIHCLRGGNRAGIDSSCDTVSNGGDHAIPQVPQGPWNQPEETPQELPSTTEADEQATDRTASHVVSPLVEEVDRVRVRLGSILGQRLPRFAVDRCKPKPPSTVPCDGESHHAMAHAAFTVIEDNRVPDAHASSIGIGYESAPAAPDQPCPECHQEGGWRGNGGVVGVEDPAVT